MPQRAANATLKSEIAEEVQHQIRSNEEHNEATPRLNVQVWSRQAFCKILMCVSAGCANELVGAFPAWSFLISEMLCGSSL